MAVRIITGTLGAGKSFYAVRMITKEFCYYVPETKTYKLKDDVSIVSNIDGLKLPHLDLKTISDGDYDSFFSYENQVSFSKNKGSLIYIIDEAQAIFHRKYYNLEVFRFFELSRHLGIDVYLLTQNPKRFCQSIIDLAECTVKAQSRSVSIMGELKYCHIVQDEIVDREVFKPDQAVFALYKSQDKKEYKKIRNPFIKYFVILVLVFGLAVWGFYSRLFGKAEALAKEVKNQDTIYSKKVSPFPSPVAPAADLVAPAVVPSLIDVRLSYVDQSGKVLLLHPLTGSIYNKKDFPYTLKFYNNEYYASVPSEEIKLHRLSEMTTAERSSGAVGAFRDRPYNNIKKDVDTFKSDVVGDQP